jgi:hypothetical protein
MIRRRRRFVHLLMMLVAAGCAKGSGSSSSSPPVPLQAGMAAVDVHVVAEPKRGLDPAFNDPGSAYGPGGAVGVFQQIDYENVQNIVVWIEPAVNGASLPAPPETTISIGDHPGAAVRGAPVGGKVVFKNERDGPLSIYSVSDGNTFDLGSIAPGQQGEYVVASAGMVEVLTESRTEPIARLYAVRSPWVQTISSSSEHAWFTNLPPGSYRAACWHERLPGSSQAVALAADQTARVSLALSVNLLPEKR